jgi:hypothetical protein
MEKIILLCLIVGLIGVLAELSPVLSSQIILLCLIVGLIGVLAELSPVLSSQK